MKVNNLKITVEYEEESTGEKVVQCLNRYDSIEIHYETDGITEQDMLGFSYPSDKSKERFTLRAWKNMEHYDDFRREK